MTFYRRCKSFILATHLIIAIVSLLFVFKIGTYRQSFRIDAVLHQRHAKRQLLAREFRILPEVKINQSSTHAHWFKQRNENNAIKLSVHQPATRANVWRR